MSTPALGGRPPNPRFPLPLMTSRLDTPRPGLGLFAYRYFVNGVWSSDLFAVGATIAVVKLSLLAWYLSTE